MGKPRRRFPGGSTGSFFVCRPTAGNGDPPDCVCFLTEEEAIKQAQAWADKYCEAIYITKYHNHCTPEINIDA